MNFAGTENEFELAMVNEPSVFEPLRFYCRFIDILSGLKQGVNPNVCL